MVMRLLKDITSLRKQLMMQSTWDCGYAKILFVNFSSAFNTIIPDFLHQKLTHTPTSIYQWITSRLVHWCGLNHLELSPNCSVCR